MGKTTLPLKAAVAAMNLTDYPLNRDGGGLGGGRKGPVQIVKEGGQSTGKNETQEGVQALNEKPKF